MLFKRKNFEQHANLCLHIDTSAQITRGDLQAMKSDLTSAIQGLQQSLEQIENKNKKQ